MRPFTTALLFSLIPWLAWAGIQIDKQVRVVKDNAAQKPERLSTYVENNQAKLISQSAARTSLFFSGSTVLACVPQGPRGNCFKKPGSLLLSSLQMGLPLEGIVRYEDYRVSDLKQTKTVANTACALHRIEYGLSLKLAGLINASAQGKSVVCFANAPRITSALESFRAQRGLEMVASPQALTGLQRVEQLGYALEIEDFSEIDSNILGQTKRQTIERKETTLAVSDWKSQPGDFDPPAHFAVVDVANLINNVGGLIKLLHNP